MTHTTDLPGGHRPPGDGPRGPAPRRPSPRPHPRNVTDSKTPASKPSSGVSEGAPGERGTAPEDSSLHSDLTTVREQVRELLAAVRAYVTPPSLFTDRPASMAELAGYARYGGWTSHTDGPLRRLGIVWHYWVGLPVTAVCRYAEWIAQRPGRAIPIFLLWKLFISTGAGPWLAGHFIHPVLGFAAWVLL